MITVFSFIPSRCPLCGVAFNIKGNRLREQDWFAGASHTCECGLHFAYAPGPAILAVASEHGDMGRYVTETEVR